MATKVSLISTTLNESKSIEQFIDSIEKLKHQPNEVIIVDAGSTDKTVNIVNQYIKDNKIQISKYKIFVKKGVSRSEGRNIAISKAKHSIIAVTDAGCVLDKRWLTEIIKPLEDKKTEVVAGFYLPISKNSFQNALSSFVCSPINKVKDGFLPSSRSIAFKKSVWLKVNGYPDDLNYCEDLVFDKKIIKAGYVFEYTPKAIVYWPQRNNLIQAYKQFYYYAFGDGQVFFSNLQTHSGKILFLYLRYIIFIIVLLILTIEPRLAFYSLGAYLLYLCFPLLTRRKQLTSFMSFLWVPVIKFTADIAVLFGSFAGILTGRK